MIGAAAFETWLSAFSGPGPWVIALAALVGLTSYSLYTIAVSIANDGAAPQDLVFISVGLLFVYCVAAIAGPTLAAMMMKAFGPQALFRQNAYIHLVVAAAALWRAIAKPAVGRPAASNAPPPRTDRKP
jgi:MFS family permease